ncbi:UDP-N-acetylglucosamine 2-epimerase [Oceanospirillaceae bacterium]|nr:UDP-N-acetylglucosamine 2-epimerase [bacterium]MDB4214357.1 UDP-N-acetylglucosamine 2-epimerase [Oceanospirillaceae bacterium]
MNRKICVITGTRAEYGRLRWVMKYIDDSKVLDLQLIVTGMHLSPEFDLTYQEIERDGFDIDSKVEMLVSADTSSGIAKSMGLGLIGFADSLQQLQPDLVLVLGDRFEILSAATAAMVARIPIVHLHGGETSEGAFDESIRHSITKMSHLHFVAMVAYRNRVIQLGEHPERVFVVGGLSSDNIKKLKLLSRDEFEASIGFKLGLRNLLITFHPVTLEDDTSSSQLEEMFGALNELVDTNLIFTFPNADTGGRKLTELIKKFVKEHENACVHASLGQLRYLSCIQYVDGVVGNSSSGISEVPSFKKGTVNIGDRQRGRVKARSIIDCKPDRESISLALKVLYSNDFQLMLKTVENPYGDGGASKKIVKIISEYPLKNILKKSFYNIESHMWE